MGLFKFVKEMFKQEQPEQKPADPPKRKAGRPMGAKTRNRVRPYPSGKPKPSVSEVKLPNQDKYHPNKVQVAYWIPERYKIMVDQIIEAKRLAGVAPDLRTKSAVFCEAIEKYYIDMGPRAIK